MSEYTQSIPIFPEDGAYIFRPNGEMFPLVQAVEELNALLTRACKAETALVNREALLAQMQSALNATYAETHHPDIGASERRPMMPHERIAWLGEDRDNWEARAKAAEAERDELMRKLSEARLKEYWESSETERQLLRRAEAAEAKLARFWSSPSCSPEIVQCSQKSSSSQPTKVETISALQAATTSIPVTTTRVAPDWQRVRIDAAIAAMQGMLARGGGGSVIARAETATEYADALVAELKKGD